MRRALLVLAASIALTAPAFAGLDQCQEPYAPVLPTPKTVTKESLHKAKDEVLRFISDSDAFQTCMLAVMAVKDKDEKLSPQQMQQAQRAIDENQAEKERVGAEYNALVKVVNGQ